MQRLIVILLMLLIGLFVGGTETMAEPQSKPTVSLLGILPLGYECTMTVYDMSDGQPNYVPARVAAYVMWAERPLSIEYYVSNDLKGVRSWSVLTRATLDQVCTPDPAG